MAESADNYWRSTSVESDGRRQSTENSNTSQSPGSELSPGTPASRSETRRRISIAEYKQRKKPTDLNSSMNNNNNTKVSIQYLSFEISKNSDSPSMVNPPIKNGQMTYRSLEEYYAHAYYFQTLRKEPIPSQPNPNNLPITPTSTTPRGIPNPGVYAHGNDTINSTESRLQKVEDWRTTPTGIDSKTKGQSMDNSFEHGGESPINRNGLPMDMNGKMAKVTAASALDDPNECKSYREWRKRKFGENDLANGNWGNNNNSGKIRKVGGWKNKGPRDNDRRQRNNRNENNGESWDTPGTSQSQPIASESWDDDVSAAQPAAAENWDDDSALPQPVPANSESWDDDPAPPVNPIPQINSESWDDDPAPPVAPIPQINLESWDDDPAPPVAPVPQINSESWDDGAAQVTANPQSNANPWNVVPAPQSNWNSDNNSSSWNRERPSRRGNRRGQQNSRSWSRDSGPRRGGRNSQNNSRPWSKDPPRNNRNSRNNSNWNSSTSTANDSQINFESWDDSPAPVPAVQNPQIDLESWDDDPTPPQPNQSVQASESWEAAPKVGGTAPPVPPRAPRISESWEDDIPVSIPNNSFGNNGNNSQDWTSGRGNSRHNSRPRKFGDNGNRRDSSHPYRGKRQHSGSRQNNWGNRSRDRSGPRRDREETQEGGRWGQEAPPLPPVLVDTFECWDDEVVVLESVETPSLPLPQIIPMAESWDDEVEAPGDVTGEAAGSSGPSAQENNSERDFNSVRAVCTTCSYKLSHYCKFFENSRSLTEIRPGELYKCICGLVFLHAGNCAVKMDQNYAPINSETGLFKQVDRSHIYSCSNCEFKFVINNLKDGTHFFSQLTTKKGDKIREKVVICDPKGIQEFMFFIEKIHESSCTFSNYQLREQFLKKKMSNICHCNQGCCTIYHNCSM